MKPNRAIAEHRHSSLDALDFFPTPPWATRALCEIVLPQALGVTLEGANVWEPACGEGHMAEVLREYCGDLLASDVRDYGYKKTWCLGSFVGEGLDVIQSPVTRVADWVITNPPFNLAEAFLDRGLREAEGVALLLRSNFIDTQGRYERIFSKTPPAVVAQFSERVPMHQGRWDPDGDTATAYAWFVWVRGASLTELMWIPPGQRQALERPDDRARFTKATEPSLI